MTDYLHSIYGRTLGVDKDGNFYVAGNVITKNNTTAPVSGATVTTETSGATLSNSGVSVLSSSPVSYTLADPVAGVRKTITAVNPTTATGRFVQTSTAGGVTIGSSGGFNKWSSTAAQTIELIGISTSVYQVVSNTVQSSLATSVGAFSTI